MQLCCSLISKFVDISKRYSSGRSAPSARGIRVVSVPGTTEVCETSHYRTISAVAASGHRWRPALSVQRCADADRSASARGRGRNLAFTCGRRRGHLLLTVRSRHMNWTHLQQVTPIIRRVHWPHASASQLDWLKHNWDGWCSVTAERMYCNVAALHWASRTGVQLICCEQAVGHLAYSTKVFNLNSLSIFAPRRCASAVYVVEVCPSVCSSVLSHTLL